jgi:hypothetical protein
MIFVILTLLSFVALFVALWYFIEWEHPWMALVVIALMVGLWIGGVKLNDKNCQVNADYKVNLYAGSNGNEIQGRFYLMGGRIDEVDMVYYWVKTEDILHKYSGKMSSSDFIEDGKNYLQVKKTVCTSKFYEAPGITGFEFHVPEGSVSNMYAFQ